MIELIALTLLLLAGLQLYQVWTKPKYVVTLASRVSERTQETVTVQAFFSPRTTPGKIWEEVESMGAVTANRRQTINDEIAEVTKKIEHEIQRRRVDRIPVIIGEIEERRNRRVAKELHMKPDEVEEVLKRYRWRGLMKMADDEEEAS